MSASTGGGGGGGAGGSEATIVARAIGTLGSATMITAEETMELLSAVRLGINLHLLDDIPATMMAASAEARNGPPAAPCIFA